MSQLMMGVVQVLRSGQGILCRPISGRAWSGCSVKAGWERDGDCPLEPHPRGKSCSRGENEHRLAVSTHTSLMLGQALQHTMLCSKDDRNTLIFQRNPVEVQRAEMGCSPSLISPFSILNTTFPKGGAGRTPKAKFLSSSVCLSFPSGRFACRRHQPCQNGLLGLRQRRKAKIFPPFCFVHSFCW